MNQDLNLNEDRCVPYMRIYKGTCIGTRFGEKPTQKMVTPTIKKNLNILIFKVDWIYAAKNFFNYGCAFSLILPLGM